MTPAIKAQLTDDRLDPLFEAFELDGRRRLLSDWHAFTFEVHGREHAYILRVTHSSHRTEADILAELEWIDCARSGGVTAPAVFLTGSGGFTAKVEAEDGFFTAVLFDKLSGRSVEERDWNAILFERWGALVGRLHRLGVQFRPARLRAHWHQSYFLNLDAYLPADAIDLTRQARAVMAEVRALPCDPAWYGTMHADVYQDNFFLQDDRLQLFDFDNSEQGHFINDVAIALYAALWRLPPGADRERFAREFLAAFWRGYETEYRLDAAQIAQLPLFLRLRDLLIYLVTRKKLDPANLSVVQARLLAERADRITRGVPVVTLAG